MEEEDHRQEACMEEEDHRQEACTEEEECTGEEACTEEEECTEEEDEEAWGWEVPLVGVEEAAFLAGARRWQRNRAIRTRLLCVERASARLSNAQNSGNKLRAV
jgi:hypothetical protein